MAIDDLARRMIRLSGLEPDKDITLEYIGLRQGEKLFEELFADGEKHRPTRYEKILVANNGIGLPAESLAVGVDALATAAQQGDADAITAILQDLVPGYNVTKNETAAVQT